MCLLSSPKASTTKTRLILAARPTAKTFNPHLNRCLDDLVRRVQCLEQHLIRGTETKRLLKPNSRLLKELLDA
jgi:hypothetical protein